MRQRIDDRFRVSATDRCECEAVVVRPPDPAQYDSFAAHYEKHAAVAPYNALYDRPATLGLLGELEAKCVLDAACGPGIYIEELLARGAEVIGCDAAPTMIDLARRRVGQRVSLRVHSLDDPFEWVEPATVDVVLCALAYHYVSNRIGFLPKRTACFAMMERSSSAPITRQRTGFVSAVPTSSCVR